MNTPGVLATTSIMILAGSWLSYTAARSTWKHKQAVTAVSDILSHLNPNSEHQWHEKKTFDRDNDFDQKRYWQRFAETIGMNSSHEFLVASTVFLITIVLSESLSYAIYALSTSITLSILVRTVSLLHSKRKLQNHLQRTQPQVLERLALELKSGVSLEVALVRTIEALGHPWTDAFGQTLREVALAMPMTHSMKAIAARFSLHEMELLAEIARDTALASDIPSIVDTLLENTIMSMHQMHLADIEKRTQLVWIPVSIAILIPGTMVLLIPLFDSLKVLANL